jgi:hypothetical protein
MNDQILISLITTIGENTTKQNDYYSYTSEGNSNEDKHDSGTAGKAPPFFGKLLILPSSLSLIRAQHF